MPQESPRTVNVTHRGARYQAHVADYNPRPELDNSAATPHLHVQNLDGGAGEVLSLRQDGEGNYENARVRQLLEENDDIASLLGVDAEQPEPEPEPIPEPEGDLVEA